MKNLKHLIAVFCILALIVGIAPYSAFAMDSSYYDQLFQYEMMLKEQLEAHKRAEQELVQAYLENQFFNVEEAYRRLVSCKNGEERETYFFSLNEYQRFRLVEYLGKMAELGLFRGFDDFDIPGLELDGSSEEKTEKSAEEQASEEERFLALYAPYIELYRLYGPAADYSGISYDAYLRIQQIVDGTPAEAPTEDTQAEATSEDKSENSADARPEAPAETETLPAPQENADSANPLDESFETPYVTEQQQFEAQYASAIEMYRQYGSAGNYDNIPYDVYLRIQAMFPAASSDEEADTPADEPAAEETETAPATEPVEENTEALTTDPSAEAEELATDPVLPAEESETKTEENPAEGEAVAEAVETEEVETIPELTEEEFLLTYYPDKVELYKEHRQFAVLNVDYETEQRIKAYVDEKYPVVTEVPETEEEELAVEAEEASEAPEDEPEDEADETLLPDANKTEVEDAVDTAPADLKEEAQLLPPIAEEILVPVPGPKAVAITSTLTDTVVLGAPVTLTGVLEDADECSNVIYKWEVNKGNGFEPVPDADGATYTFLASKESLSWSWRLSVLYR